MKLANHPAQVVQALSSIKATTAALATSASSNHHAVLSTEALDPIDAVTVAPMAIRGEGDQEDEDNGRADGEDEDDMNGEGIAVREESTPWSYGTAEEDEPPRSCASEQPIPAPVSVSGTSNHRVLPEGGRTSFIDGNSPINTALIKSPGLDKDQQWHPDLPQLQSQRGKKSKLKKRKRAIVEGGEGEQRQDDGDDIDDIFSLLAK